MSLDKYQLDYKQKYPLHGSVLFDPLDKAANTILTAVSDVNSVDEWQQTLLHAAACRKDGRPLVQMLLLLGADRNRKTEWDNTPLQNAQGHNGYVFFYNNNYNGNGLYYFDRTKKEDACTAAVPDLESGLSRPIPDDIAQSLFHWACTFGSVRLLDALLNYVSPSVLQWVRTDQAVRSVVSANSSTNPDVRQRLVQRWGVKDPQIEKDEEDRRRLQAEKEKLELEMRALETMRAEQEEKERRDEEDRKRLQAEKEKLELEKRKLQEDKERLEEQKKLEDERRRLEQERQEFERQRAEFAARQQQSPAKNQASALPQIGTLPGPSRPPPATAPSLPTIGGPSTTASIPIASYNPTMTFKSDFVVLKDEHDESIELGNGANGTVYRARLTAGKEVAAKKLHKTVPFEAVQQEIDLMSRVNGHPNVVLLIGACPSPAYIVMELIEGPTLKQHLFPDGGGRSTLDMATAVRLAAGVASGLAHLHSATDPTTGNPRPIVHRDLNPNNVMLTTPDPVTATLKITDLGLGRAIRSSTSTGGVSITNSGVRGTLGYIAPEILLDEKSYTHKVDVFSFGMLLWTMLTSQWAYEGKVDMTKDPASISLSIVQLLQADIDARPAIPSSWPKDIQGIVRECWATDPSKRPEMIKVASDLEAFLKN